MDSYCSGEADRFRRFNTSTCRSQASNFASMFHVRSLRLVPCAFSFALLRVAHPRKMSLEGAQVDSCSRFVASVFKPPTVYNMALVMRLSMVHGCHSIQMRRPRPRLMFSAEQQRTLRLATVWRMLALEKAWSGHALKSQGASRSSRKWELTLSKAC